MREQRQSEQEQMERYFLEEERLPPEVTASPEIKRQDHVSQSFQDRLTRGVVKAGIKTGVSKWKPARDLYYHLQLSPWTRMVNGVILDICTVCNAQCVYCLHQRNHQVKPQFMDDAVFASVVRILKRENFKLVYLFLSGEPFLHPDIYGMMWRIAQSGMGISIATRLNEEINFPELAAVLYYADIKQQCVNLLITVDSLEHPEVISSGMNKNLIIANIKSLAELPKSKYVKFQFSSLVTSVNEDELPSIQAKLASWGFTNWYPASVSYYASKRASAEDIATMKEFMPTKTKFCDRFDIVGGKVIGYKKPPCGCMIPNISPAGEVSLCFYDMLHQVTAGNVLEVGSLRRIMGSAEYRNMTKLGREMKLTICEGCN